MTMPYNLERLPPEALQLLRYMNGETRVSMAQMEAGTGLSSRLVGRAIRRLVNFDQIELIEGLYQLTTDGHFTARQLLEYDSLVMSGGAAPYREPPPVPRRLTVVLPRVLPAYTGTAVFFGVNPPEAGVQRLPAPARVDLRVSAVHGVFSEAHTGLLIPSDQAASPAQLSLTPTQAGRAVRVRVDAFQTLDLDTSEPLGGMYFDVQVAMTPDSTDRAMRAVGMDLLLKPLKFTP